MKGIIIICLLSVGMCLSDQTSQPVEASQAASAPVEQKAPVIPTAGDKHTPITENKQESSTKAEVKNETLSTPSTKVTPNDTVQNSAGTEKNEASKTESNKTTANKNETEESSKSDNKVPDNKEAEPAKQGVTEKINTTEQTPAEKKTTIKPDTVTDNSTKPADKGEATKVVPPHADPTKPTEAPLKARSFDGPSFIGGIILTLGLLAIGFMGFKYYKNQTERNYHTL